MIIYSVGGQNISDGTTNAATTTSQRIVREASLMYASCPVKILNHCLWGCWYLQTSIEVCVLEDCVDWVRDCSSLCRDAACWTLLPLQDSILLEYRWSLQSDVLGDIRRIQNCLLLKALTLEWNRFAARDGWLLSCVNNQCILVYISLNLLIYDHLHSFSITGHFEYFLFFL